MCGVMYLEYLVLGDATMLKPNLCKRELFLTTAEESLGLTVANAGCNEGCFVLVFTNGRVLALHAEAANPDLDEMADIWAEPDLFVGQAIVGVAATACSAAFSFAGGGAATIEAVEEGGWPEHDTSEHPVRREALVVKPFENLYSCDDGDWAVDWDESCCHGS